MNINTFDPFTMRDWHERFATMSRTDLTQVAEILHTQLAQKVREECDRLEVGNIFFKCTISGRTHDKLKVSYDFGRESYDCISDAGSITPLMQEFFRRENWKAENAAKKITYQGEME